MNTVIHEVNGREVIEVLASGIILERPQDLLDLVAGVQSRTLILRKENIHGEFFRLSSGIAGAILQKASNYRIRMAIVGDFSGTASRSLADFIGESNRTGQVLFVPTLAAALEAFAR